MEINISRIAPAISGSTAKKINTNRTYDTKFNCSYANGYPQQKNISFSGFFPFPIFTHRTNKTQTSPIEEKNVSEFAQNISTGIKDIEGLDIPAKNFRGIMSPAELRELLPSLKAQNFVSSRDNQESGIYYVDLDYQSNFSNGKENIYDILDNVAIFANRYYDKHGKDFVFALTDRDSIESLQHVVRIIGENPDRFEHVKFVPGLKLSFAHEAPESKLKYENSEMLVYGVNPYSQNVIDFLDSTINNRKKMCIDFIRQVRKLYPEFSYNIREFAEQNKLKYKDDYAVSNLYWRAREYAERKGGSDIGGELPPEQILRDADNILDNLEKLLLGSDLGFYSGIDSEITSNNKVNKDIEEVFEYYSTHYDEKQGKVVSFAENLYDDMINTFANEPQKPVLAISAPYYFCHYFGENKSKLTVTTLDKVVNCFKELQSRSQGMLCAFESETPSYDLDIILGRNTINAFNDYMRENTEFYEVGGSFAKRNMP